MAGRVALVTCQRARGLDSDEPLLLAALAAIDVRVEVLDWDRAADWPSYELAVIRSTWDYARRHQEFLSWAAVTGGQDTARYEPGQLAEARAHVARLHAEQRVAMVQPYLEAVEAEDETTLVYIGGQFSHAAAKGALLLEGAAQPGLFADERVAPRIPSSAERALGDATMDWLSGSRLGSPLYARIDLLPDADGRPRILEVELTEPSLFLETDLEAADRMAAAIRALLQR